MTRLGRAVLVGLMLAGSLSGCSVSPAEQAAIRRAWTEHEIDVAQEVNVANAQRRIFERNRQIADRSPHQIFTLRMILSENRLPLFGIMR